MWPSNCLPPGFEIWTTAEVGNDVVKSAKIQICLENITSVVVKSNLKIPAFYIIIANFRWRCAKFQIQSASLWFIEEHYIKWKHIKMKVLYYLLVLSIPLMNAFLFNNITDSINTRACQCTCHNPYLGKTGDTLSARSFVELDCHEIFNILYRN